MNTTPDDPRDLIAEAREIGSDYKGWGCDGSASICDRRVALIDCLAALTTPQDGGDALAARQPTEDDREALLQLALDHDPDDCHPDDQKRCKCGVLIGESDGVVVTTDGWGHLVDAVLAAGFSRAAVPDAAPTLCVECNEVEVLGKPEHRVLCMDCAYETGRAAVPDAANRELTEAIRLTVEYVGNDMLPAIEGWDWYDALVKYAPEVAQAFVDKPIHFPKSAERDAALAAIERVRAIHVRHKDTHKPDPSVINGNWFCCGAVQLGAVDPYACIACDSPEWPCPTVAALDGAPEPAWEYRYAEKLGDTEYTYGPEHDDRGWFATAEEASAARIEDTDYVVRRRPAGLVEPLPVEGETSGE